MVEARGAVLLASRSDAVAIAASKSATAQRLAAHGVPVVPTIDPSRIAGEFGIGVPSFDRCPHPDPPPRAGEGDIAKPARGKGSIAKPTRGEGDTAESVSAVCGGEGAELV
jgi:hypothetical protein